MTIGYSARGQCFDNTSDAIDVFYSGVQPFIANFVSSTRDPLSAYHYYVFLKDSGVWKVGSISVASNTISIFTAAPIEVYGSCTLENDPVTHFPTAFDLGLAVAFAMVVVFAIRRIYK